MNIKDAKKLKVGDVVKFKVTEENPRGWGIVGLVFKRQGIDHDGNKFITVLVEREVLDFTKLMRSTNLR